MALTEEQIGMIQEAHADGLLDRQIAEYVGISLSSVKRYRKKLGLETNSSTARRGRLGEQIVAMYAANRGLRVTWRKYDTEAYDLMVEGRRVDAKTAMVNADGTWAFRLPNVRWSFYGQYSYPKDYSSDCEVIAFVCLHDDGREPDLYFVDSQHVPGTVVIRKGGIYEAFKDAWDLLEVQGPRLRA